MRSEATKIIPILQFHKPTRSFAPFQNGQFSFLATMGWHYFIMLHSIKILTENTHDQLFKMTNNRPTKKTLHLVIPALN